MLKMMMLRVDGQTYWEERFQNIYELASKRNSYLFRTCISDVEYFNDEVF